MMTSLNWLMGTWIVVSNLLLLINMRKCSRFSRINALLTKGLALTDVLTGLVDQLSTMMVRVDPLLIRIPFICALRALFVLFLCCASISQLAVITCIKLVHIKYPIKYNYYITDTSLKLILCSVWAVCFSILFTILDPPDRTDVFHCIEIYSLMMTTFTFGYTIVVIATCLMAGLHYYFMRLSDSHIERIAKIDPQQSEWLVEDAKARKVFTIITVAMTLCYLPNIITYYVIHFSSLPLCGLVIDMWELTVLVGVSGTNVNLFVHCYQDKRLRSEMIRMATGGVFQRSRVPNPSSQSQRIP